MLGDESTGAVQTHGECRVVFDGVPVAFDTRVRLIGARRTDRLKGTGKAMVINRVHRHP